jgi:hypothetical protein
MQADRKLTPDVEHIHTIIEPYVTQFQLMKFQLHPFRFRQNQNTTRISSCARYPPQVLPYPQ